MLLCGKESYTGLNINRKIESATTFLEKIYVYVLKICGSSANLGQDTTWD